MKLIGLFGVLLAISPVFAADPGECAGQVPTMTVEKCNGQSCSFEYVEGTRLGTESRIYHSCNEPPRKEVNCKTLKTMDDCLSHSCSWIKTTNANTSKTELKCLAVGRQTSTKWFKVQAPKKITEL